MSAPRPTVALAHDYLTQRGGAERVALLMTAAFPDARLHTSLYEPVMTFPEFRQVRIAPLALNRVAFLRRWHRLAFPLLAPSFSARSVDAEVLVASSSGWAHGVRTTGRKVVYCHAPARWLYQRDRYLGRDAGVRGSGQRHRLAAAPVAASLLSRPLRRWDRWAAASADRYLANSTATQSALRAVYGIEADLLLPPPALLPDGPEQPVPGIAEGYFLCVARLLPYKHVSEVIDATQRLGERLVVVGEGPDRPKLQRLADVDGGVSLLGRIDDSQLRWLYRNCRALVAASYEDYGLSPLEAAAFGRPSVTLRGGGYLDTVREGTTGLFFDAPTPAAIAAALRDAVRQRWEPSLLTDHAAMYSSERFVAQLRQVVDEERRR